MNWQPIETAPKDGTRMMLIVPCAVPVQTGNFNTVTTIHNGVANIREYWSIDGFLLPFGDRLDPTHWAPIPGTPK